MNESGLARAIFIGMVLIVLTGLVLGFLLSRILARRLGWSRAKTLAASAGLGALGVGVGVLAVTATFFESTWAPPPQVTFKTPAGFAHSWVIVLEDRAAAVPLVWTGVEIPFSGKKTVIDVPASGIVRLRDLSGLGGRVDIDVVWSDGFRNTSQGGGPAPPPTRATTYSAFNRVNADAAASEDPPFGDGAALAAYIAARERR